MKITKQQLQQIIKEELNAFLNEAFDDPLRQHSNTWDNKEIEPFSRANMFIRDAEAEDFLDEGPLAIQANEIAKSIFEQMLQDQNLPKHPYIEKIKKDVKAMSDKSPCCSLFCFTSSRSSCRLVSINSLSVLWYFSKSSTALSC